MASNGSGLSACVLFAFFDIARTIYGSSSGRGKGYFSVGALKRYSKKGTKHSYDNLWTWNLNRLYWVVC